MWGMTNSNPSCVRLNDFLNISGPERPQPRYIGAVLNSSDAVAKQEHIEKCSSLYMPHASLGFEALSPMHSLHVEIKALSTFGCKGKRNSKEKHIDDIGHWN